MASVFLLAILRYLFLFFFYCFLISVILLMFWDTIRKTRTMPGKVRIWKRVLPVGKQAKTSPFLLALASADPRLKMGTTIFFEGEITIGREKGNTLVLADPFVSARHAKITSTDGRFWLEDLGSLNGTYLNGVKVEKPVVLSNGDRIRVGEAVFQFVRWDYEVGYGN